MYDAGVSSSSRFFASLGSCSVSTKARMPSASTRLPRVSSLSFSYGDSTPYIRMTVCTGSASTSQLESRSALRATVLTSTLPSPLSAAW